MQRRVAAITDLFGSTLHGWWDDEALRLGASLAYYTLFAIAPILLVATAVAGMAFGAEPVRGIGHDSPAVGVLLLSDPVVRCRVHARAYAERRGMTLQTAALTSKDVTPLRRPR
jgi:hypothetical protein